MSRILAIIIAFAELVFITKVAGSETAARWLVFMIAPVAYIWFSDEAGSVTRGKNAPFYSSILRPSPGWLVKIVAFVVLLLPIIMIILFPM